MNFILNDRTRACCSVATPWNLNTGSSLTYGVVEVTQSSNKRSSSTSTLSSQAKSQASVVLSVWTASVFKPPGATYKHLGPNTSQAVPKSFRRLYISRKMLDKATGPTRLLDVRTVLDVSWQEEYTYVLLRISRHRNDQHVLALFYIDCDQLTLYEKILISEVPSHAILMRGPSIITCTGSVVKLYSMNSTQSNLSPLTLLQAPRSIRYAVCATEKDNVSLLYGIDEGPSSSQRLPYVQPVTSNGELFPSVQLQGANDVDFLRGNLFMAASIKHGFLVVGNPEQSAIVFGIPSARAIFRVTYPSTESAAQMSIIDRTLFFVSLSPLTDSTLLQVSLPMTAPGLTSSNEVAALVSIKAKPAFSTCDGCNVPSPHSHFYAMWRRCLLQLSDATGVCCAEFSCIFRNEEFNESDRAGSTSVSTQCASPAAVVSRLRKRLDIGIDRLIEIVERNEEKRNMLQFVVRLVGDVARTGDVAPRAGVLDVRLRSIACRDERDPVSVDNDVDRANRLDNRTDIKAPSLHLWVTGQSHRAVVAPFAKISNPNFCLDATERYVIINVDAEVIPPEMSSDDVKPLTLMLAAYIDPCIASTWKTTLARNILPGRIVQLGAAVPLADVVTAATGLGEVGIEMRLEIHDGRSQRLGWITLNGLLSRTDGTLSKRRVPELVHAYQQVIYLIIQGSLLQRPNQLPRQLTSIADVLYKRKGTTCLTIKVCDGVELATVAARLKLAIEKNSKIQQILPLRKSSLKPVDNALIALKEEVRYVRGVAASKDAIGFSPEQIIHVLELQQIVDTAFGRLQEMLLGI